MVPNVVAFAGFGALVLALEIQVRLVEEPCLEQCTGRPTSATRRGPGASRRAWVVWVTSSDSALDSTGMRRGSIAVRLAPLLAAGALALHKLNGARRWRRVRRPRALLPSARCRARHRAAGTACARFARELWQASHGRLAPAAPPSFPTLWIAAAGALLATFALQEWIEGWITRGIPRRSRHALAHIGWTTPTLAAGLGCVIALLVRGTRSADGTAGPAAFARRTAPRALRGRWAPLPSPFSFPTFRAGRQPGRPRATGRLLRLVTCTYEGGMQHGPHRPDQHARVLHSHDSLAARRRDGAGPPVGVQQGRLGHAARDPGGRAGRRPVSTIPVSKVRPRPGKVLVEVLQVLPAHHRLVGQGSCSTGGRGARRGSRSRARRPTRSCSRGGSSAAGASSASGSTSPSGRASQARPRRRCDMKRKSAISGSLVGGALAIAALAALPAERRRARDRVAVPAPDQPAHGRPHAVRAAGAQRARHQGHVQGVAVRPGAAPGGDLRAAGRPTGR